MNKLHNIIKLIKVFTEGLIASTETNISMLTEMDSVTTDEILSQITVEEEMSSEKFEQYCPNGLKLKIKLSIDDREARKQMITEICDKSQSEEVQSIGKTLSVYRVNPDKAIIDIPKD